MNGYDGDGAAYFGTKGAVMQDRDGFFRLYDTKNKVIKEWKYGDESTAHMQNFLDCIQSRQAPNSPVEMGNRVIIGAHLANISYRTGKRIGWDPLRETRT